MKKETNLGTENIGRLLFRLSLPAIIAQMINVLYNIVDRIFIGHIPEVGAMALTGVGVSFPIIMIISAFSALVGAGGSPLVAIRLGKSDLDGAERILGNATSLLMLIGVSLTVFFLIFQRPILMAFGASENTIDYALQYLTIYLLGTVFVKVNLGLNAYINTQGFAKMGMLTVVIGAVLNIILDPIFIFGFNMGVRGAAFATIISQGVSALWVLRFLTGKKTTIRIKKKFLKLEKALVFSILALGSSPFIMQSTESLLNLTLNISLQHFGGDLAVGAMTIIGSLTQMVFLPLMGLTMGGQPIISYNFGAGNFERVRKTYKLLILVGFILSFVLWLIMMFLTNSVVGIFTNDVQLLDLTVWAVRIYMLMILLMGLQITCQQTFLALGQAKISIFLAMLRKLILLIPLIILLPRIAGLGMTGIFLAQPIADFISVSTTVIVFFVQIKKIVPKSESL